MSTKGPSNRYGNTKGANRRGEKSADIGYPWAKDFCRGGLQDHFERHGKELKIASAREYASKAVHFANEVNRSDYKATSIAMGRRTKSTPGGTSSSKSRRTDTSSRTGGSGEDFGIILKKESKNG